MKRREVYSDIYLDSINNIKRLDKDLLIMLDLATEKRYYYPRREVAI